MLRSVPQRTLALQPSTVGHSIAVCFGERFSALLYGVCAVGPSTRRIGYMWAGGWAYPFCRRTWMSIVEGSEDHSVGLPPSVLLTTHDCVSTRTQSATVPKARR